MPLTFKIWLLLTFLFCCQTNYAQIDTLRLKKEVENLIDYDSKLRFLTKIETEDQAFRGKQTNDSLDLEHLISISYFVNKFGYPTKSTYGNAADAAWLAWIYQKYRSIDLLSSSIIVKGFLAGELKEKEIRNYYFRQFYTYKFDDNRYLEMPLKVFFDTTAVDVNGPVSIEKIMLEVAKHKQFEQTQRAYLGKWQSPSKTTVYELNGQKIPKTFKGTPVEIFTFRDRRIFFQKIYEDGSHEPVELMKIGDKKYKFKHQQTDKYFEIEDTGNLLYCNDSTIFETYISTEISR